MVHQIDVCQIKGVTVLVVSSTSFDTRLLMKKSLAYFDCVTDFYQNIIFCKIIYCTLKVLLFYYPKVNNIELNKS